MRYTPLLAFLLLLAGCVTTANQVDPKQRTRRYDAKKQKVFDAVVQAVSDRGYTVKTVSRKSGVLVTEPKAPTVGARPFKPKTQQQVQALVEQREKGTALSLTITLTYASGRYKGQSVPESTGDVENRYEEWFEHIENHLRQ